jgi:hypothetical protein
MLLRRSLCWLTFALTLTPVAAWAEPTDADRGTARILAIEGQKAFNKQDFTTAVDRFTRADSLVHAPTLALALAQSQAALGKLVTAQEIYNRVAREGVAPKSPPSWTKAVDDARKEAALMAPRIPSVTITVRGASDATVTLDGVPVPSAALGAKRPVDPGKHTIRAEAKGLVAAEASLTLAEGQNEAVVLELKSASAQPKSLPAPPVAAAKPPERPTPASDIALAPEPPLAPDAPARSPQKTVGVIALGVGGAGLLLGGITGGVAVGKHGALKAACGNGPCDASQQGAVDAYHLMGALSTAGFVVGGVGAAAGVVLLLTASGAPAPKEARFTPVIGLGYLGAEGTF